MKAAKTPAPGDRERAYQRLGRWLSDMSQHLADGPVLWVDPAVAPQAPLERWLLHNANVSVSTRLRLRSASRLSQEWLSEALLPVPEALDRSSWRAISLVVAADGPTSVQAVADLVWHAHAASLGAPAAPWLQVLDEPWRTSALRLEQAAAEGLVRLRMPPDLERLGRDALLGAERGRRDRLLLLDDASTSQREMAKAAARAGVETLTVPLHLAATDLTGARTAGEELAWQLRSATGGQLPDHLSLVVADDVSAEARLVAAQVRGAVSQGVDPERIVVAVALASQLPAMARALRSAGLRPACRGGMRPNWAAERWLTAVAGLIREPSQVDAWQGLTDSALGPGDVPPPTGSRLLRRLTLETWLIAPPASLSRLLAWPAKATVEQHLERLFSVYHDSNLVSQVEDLGTAAVSALNHHLALLRHLAEVAGGRTVSRERWADVLIESLPALALEDAATGRHQVQLVTLSQAAGRPSDLLWLTGLVAGTLPGTAATALPVAADGPWRPWLEERERRAEALVDRLLAACRGEVWASYPRRDSSGAPFTPALWVERLRQGGVAVTEASALGALSMVSSIQQMGRALSLERARLSLSAATPDPGWTEQMRQLEDLGLRYGPQLRSGREDLTADLAQSVFGSSFSVTDLEERAKCPTRHLVRALTWQEPAVGMDARTWGIAMHGLMAKAAANEAANWAVEVSQALDDLALPELADPTERAYWQSRLTEVISALAPCIRYELEKSQADQSAQEIAFGANAGEGIGLTLTDGTVVRVRGRIDRMDRFGDAARVVDYKSTAARTLREGRWTRLAAQVDLQLLAYGLAVRQQGLKPIALEYVSLATPWTNDEGRGEERQVLSRAGLYAARPGLAEVLGVHEGQDLVKPDGTVSPRGGALTPDQLERLIDLTEARLTVLAEAARRGQSAPDPVRIGRSLTCHSCPLQPVCRYEGAGERQVASVTRAEFVAWIDR